jgi:hypothetical protein|tara:strand:+ start:6626 stop:6835 length:210 start_codon:yes stop_codon:yes gene_type:complete
VHDAPAEPQTPSRKDALLHPRENDDDDDDAPLALIIIIFLATTAPLVLIGLEGEHVLRLAATSRVVDAW